MSKEVLIQLQGVYYLVISENDGIITLHYMAKRKVNCEPPMVYDEAICSPEIVTIENLDEEIEKFRKIAMLDQALDDLRNKIEQL